MAGKASSHSRKRTETRHGIDHGILIAYIVGKMKSLPFDYQTYLITQIIAEFKANHTDVVLAAACGGGKTFMSIAICEELIREYPTLRILVLTHGQTVLRTNFVDEIKAQKPVFTYVAVGKNSDLNIKAQVYVGLPQTIHRYQEHKFDVIIVDEAHQFYFARDGMVSRIIGNSKPRFTLFLTGSPSKFIKEKYILYSISLLELYEKGRVCSPIIELAKTSYDFTFSDYNADDELKTAVQFSSAATTATLDDLLRQVERVITSVTRIKPEIRNAITVVWKWALGSLGKTMFVCRSQAQASQVRYYFDRAGLDVALSTSDFDADSKEIDRFKLDPECKVLVVVNRGTLGFNMPELMNIIDMSGSLNADVLFQMFARLVRNHPNNKGKLFLKVVPEPLAEYTYTLMSFVVALSTKAVYDTYTGDYKKIRTPIHKNLFRTSDEITDREGMQRTLRVSELPPIPTFDVMINLRHKVREVLASYAYTSLELIKDRLSYSPGLILSCLENPVSQPNPEPAKPTTPIKKKYPAKLSLWTCIVVGEKVRYFRAVFDKDVIKPYVFRVDGTEQIIPDSPYVIRYGYHTEIKASHDPIEAHKIFLLKCNELSSQGEGFKLTSKNINRPLDDLYMKRVYSIDPFKTICSTEKSTNESC